MDRFARLLVLVLVLLGGTLVAVAVLNRGRAAGQGSLEPAISRDATPGAERRSEVLEPAGGRVAVVAEAGSVPETSEEPAEIVADAARGLGDWLRELKPDQLAGLTDGELLALTDLDLRGADLVDEDLRLLGQLTNLRNLSLYGTPVTDAGLAHLAGLHQLESIILRGTQVTGVGLQYLPTQTLTALHLCSSKITGADLASTPVMPKLERLKLNFLALEDDAVEYLNVYPSLRHVELDQSRITDAGLTRMLELNPGLTRVEIRGTEVSGECLTALRQLYPECEFVHEYGGIVGQSGR